MSRMAQRPRVASVPVRSLDTICLRWRCAVLSILEGLRHGVSIVTVEQSVGPLRRHVAGGPSASGSEPHDNKRYGDRYRAIHLQSRSGKTTEKDVDVAAASVADLRNISAQGLGRIEEPNESDSYSLFMQKACKSMQQSLFSNRPYSRWPYQQTQASEALKISHSLEVFLLSGG